jgi:hypothetical protein
MLPVCQDMLVNGEQRSDLWKRSLFAQLGRCFALSAWPLPRLGEGEAVLQSQLRPRGKGYRVEFKVRCET